MAMNYESHDAASASFDHFHSNRVINEASISLRKFILNVPGFNEDTILSVFLTLIEYYYDNYDAELWSCI